MPRTGVLGTEHNSEDEPMRLLLVGFMILAPMVSLAQSLGDGRAPLLTIRFNQPNVYYDQQLYSAISKAVQAKPDVMFDLVAFAPTAGTPQGDRQWQSIAGKNTKAVLHSMTSMGVPMERIQVIGKSTPGLRFDETHIYIR